MNQRARRSPALIELIIIICFMAIALTVVVQLFAQVFLDNKNVAWQNNAMLAMQDRAELFKADPDALQTGDRFYYDEQFLQQQPDTSSYYIKATVTQTVTPAGTLYEVTFVAGMDEEGQFKEIGQLATAHYVPTVVETIAQGGTADE